MKRARRKVNHLVHDLCSRYDEATRESVWFRVNTLHEYHDIPIGKTLRLIDATFGDDLPNARTTESVQTEGIDPTEVTFVGVVVRIIWDPARNTREVWFSDGTGRIRVQVPESEIERDAEGELRVIRYVEETDDAEQWTDQFDRVVIEPLP